MPKWVSMTTQLYTYGYKKHATAIMASTYFFYGAAFLLAHGFEVLLLMSQLD